jgi:hypothetical protein
MAVKTNCATPGAIFSTHIQPQTIEIVIDLPNSLDLTEAQAIQLEGTIHNALELALAPLFVTR